MAWRSVGSVRSGAALVLAAWALSAGLVGCGGGAGDWPARGMNLLLVTVDTTRADVLGCYGGDPRTTPNLDRLAGDGVRFSNAYSATNVTKPAHLSIMTGKRSVEHRVFNNQALVPPGTEALPLYMRRAGYRTAGFVAAVQLGDRAGWEGFDVIEGPPKGRSQRAGKEVVDRALEWLKRGTSSGSSAPFFLWTHLFDPHTLYTPPAKLARRYYSGNPKLGDGPLIGEAEWFQTWDYNPMHEWIEGVRDEAYAKAMYAAEMEYSDAQIQRLLAYLETTGITDETVVVLVADHGESFGEHGVYYDHAGLYESSLRIPLIVRVPGMEGGGRVVGEFATQLDILPTLSDLFGLGVSVRTSASGGRSLRPLLEGRREGFDPREYVLFESAHNHHVAVRKGRWKYIHPVFDEHRFFGVEPMLFDLETDPDELRDVRVEHAEVVRELEALVEPWVRMGTIKKGELPLMSEDVLRGLDDLGYAGGDD